MKDISLLQRALNPIPKIITENPFRILGVYANSPKKDIISNQSKATKFLKVGREVDFPLDLKGILPPLTRTVDMFTKASGNLAVAKEQFKYAQFWFLKSTPIDEVAFNHLVTGDMAKAVEIWEKKDTATSLQNRMICHFILGDNELAINAAEYLYAKFADEFLTIADTTGTLRFDSDNMVHQFIDNLSQYIDSTKIMNYACSQEWKEYSGGKTVKPLIEKINTEIVTAKNADGDDPDASRAAGEKLIQNTKQPFAQLKKILKKDDPQFETIADKLGLQILQCGINYYNNTDDEDAAENAMSIQKVASSIVVGSLAKDRCKENLKVLEKIISELPPKEVRKEFKEIENTLAMFIVKPESISSAVWLLNTSKPILQSIKSKIGSTHTLYIQFSTVIARMASSHIIDEVNDVQSSSEVRMRMQMGLRLDASTITKIKNTISEGWKAFAIIEDFDMDSEFRMHYNKNRESLKSLCQNLGISTTISKPRQVETTQKTTYISTPRTTYPNSSSSSSNSSSNKSDQKAVGCIIGIICIVIMSLIGGSVNKGEGAGVGACIGAFIGFTIYRIMNDK